MWGLEAVAEEVSTPKRQQHVRRSVERRRRTFKSQVEDAEARGGSRGVQRQRTSAPKKATVGDEIYNTVKRHHQEQTGEYDRGMRL